MSEIYDLFRKRLREIDIDEWEDDLFGVLHAIGDCLNELYFKANKLRECNCVNYDPKALPLVHKDGTPVECEDGMVDMGQQIADQNNERFSIPNAQVSSFVPALTREQVEAVMCEFDPPEIPGIPCRFRKVLESFIEE